MRAEPARWIDEVSRCEHRYLTPAEHCLYFGEFRPGRGAAGGPVNALILDFKRAPRRIAAGAQPLALRYFKERAIRRVAARVRATFGRAAVERVLTFVPIPGSCAPGHPDHCDRLLRTLRHAFSGLHADIRPLLTSASMTPDHRQARRVSYEQLLAATRVDAAHWRVPPRALIVLFDDVLTSGKHLQVAIARIRERAPAQAILGLVIARCAREGPP